MKNANLLSAIPVSGRLFTRRTSFLNFHKRLITRIMRSFDSCLHDASAAYGVDYVNHNISGIKSNNLVYKAGLEAAGRILYEFAYHQLRDSGNA